MEGSMCLAVNTTITLMHRKCIGRLVRGYLDNGVAGLIKLASHSQPEWGGGELSLSVLPGSS